MIHPNKPVQIAYFVNDIEQAAKKMADSMGAGPFYVIKNIELEWGEHRGSPCEFIHSSALGQWGEMMVEFVQQDNEAPSPFRDMFSPGQEGVHHVACFVDSVPQTLQNYETMGFATATRAGAKKGTEFAFIDTREILGHMLEVYEADDTLRGIYELVRTAAQNWDGQDPVRQLSL